MQRLKKLKYISGKENHKWNKFELQNQTGISYNNKYTYNLLGNKKVQVVGRTKKVREEGKADTGYRKLHIKI